MPAKRNQRASGKTTYFFDRRVCNKRCGRHVILESKEPEYEITASAEHNKKVIAGLREQHDLLVSTGKLDPRDRFIQHPVMEIPIKQLLPSQSGLDHPDKFCYVANRPVLNCPIIVAKISGRSFLTLPDEIKKVAGTGKYIIIDGHTRAAVKFAEAKDRGKATIKAIVLEFPSAGSFYQSHIDFKRAYPNLSINHIISRAKYKLTPENTRKHPAACPGIKKMKK